MSASGVRRSTSPVLRPSRIAKRARGMGSVYRLRRANSDCCVLVLGLALELAMRRSGVMSAFGGKVDIARPSENVRL